MISFYIQLSDSLGGASDSVVFGALRVKYTFAGITAVCV